MRRTNQPWFDAKVFESTASRFAVKREALLPAAVQALASDIVHCLATSMSTDGRIDEVIVGDESWIV